mgnify:CR=1 FL=1
MAKSKISSKDFLDLLDEQDDQPAPALGSFGRAPSPLPVPFSSLSTNALNEVAIETPQKTGHKLNTKWTQTAHKVDTQPDTQPDTSLSSSSSFINIKMLENQYVNWGLVSKMI